MELCRNNSALERQRIYNRREQYTVHNTRDNHRRRYGVDELADPELVSTEVFHLVINAMLIYRYGLGAVKLKREG